MMVGFISNHCIILLPAVHSSIFLSLSPAELPGLVGDW